MDGTELIAWAYSLGPKPYEKAEKARREEKRVEWILRHAPFDLCYNVVEEFEEDEIMWQGMIRIGCHD